MSKSKCWSNIIKLSFRKSWCVSHIHIMQRRTEEKENMRYDIGWNLNHDYFLTPHTCQGTNDLSTCINRNWNKLACIREPGFLLFPSVNLFLDGPHSRAKASKTEDVITLMYSTKWVEIFICGPFSENRLLKSLTHKTISKQISTRAWRGEIEDSFCDWREENKKNITDEITHISLWCPAGCGWVRGTRMEQVSLWQVATNTAELQLHYSLQADACLQISRTFILLT